MQVLLAPHSSGAEQKRGRSPLQAKKGLVVTLSVLACRARGQSKGTQRSSHDGPFTACITMLPRQRSSSFGLHGGTGGHCGPAAGACEGITSADSTKVDGRAGALTSEDVDAVVSTRRAFATADGAGPSVGGSPAQPLSKLHAIS